MKVIVTGGTGFVGRYVVNLLLEKGYEVHLIVRNREKALSLFGDRAELHETDLGDAGAIRKLVEGLRPDAVIHLVGILFEERRKGLTFEKVHYLYSVNLYNASKEAGVSRVVHMSALGTNDAAPSRYHQTKRWAEKHLEKTGIPWTVFRPSLILGPEQRLFADMDRITRILPIVALPGGGSYRFQPVDVRDVAECFVTALEKREAEGRIYELCGTEAVTFRKLLSDIFSFWGRRVLMLPLPLKLMFYMGWVVERLLEPPPFSSDQILMMWRDNVCGEMGDAVSDGVRDLLGRDPIPYRESLSWSLRNYGKAGG
ncbi:MAG TPA: complex I NDUFA9 subunit family protein [Aquifex aeolicus]|uniref:Complex I NDUFA9 subunit family protein n=1 Tax=Aquifex aeolicus TaxID=63363 RepID=A0A7C5QAG7_AQUAO|nr:complex I NDUFA9 subunit family protein [Aquifex aeolicus]